MVTNIDHSVACHPAESALLKLKKSGKNAYVVEAKKATFGRKVLAFFGVNGYGRTKNIAKALRQQLGGASPGGSDAELVTKLQAVNAFVEKHNASLWVRKGPGKRIEPLAVAVSSKPADSVTAVASAGLEVSAGEESVADVAVKHHKFTGYAVKGISSRSGAASNDAVPAIRDGKMLLTQDVSVPGVGTVNNCYTWVEAPALDAPIPDFIKGAAVRLPAGVSASDYERMRRTVQEGVSSGNGISPEVAQEVALSLGGIVIEATLPYRAGALLGDDGPDVEVHCIIQTGLNFNGIKGGGIPLTDLASAAKEVVAFSEKNTEAAVRSAIGNGSDVLVYNLGIGTGFFGGRYGRRVKQANINGLCNAAQTAASEGSKMEIIVPDVALSEAQKKQLEAAGIQIIPADKDAVAVLYARKGVKVSETIAGDPMSTLGIHGPGFWWETAGSASDEERAAFLSPCYALGHIPIDVYPSGEPPQRIAALSEFMRQ